jgi:hypothetical protein
MDEIFYTPFSKMVIRSAPGLLLKKSMDQESFSTWTAHGRPQTRVSVLLSVT